MAGNTLWNGVLLVLDAVFHVKNEARLHPDVNDYRINIGKRDKKLLALFNAGYETMHVTMGYDGNPGKDVCKEGFRIVEEIIERCEKLLKH